MTDSQFKLYSVTLGSRASEYDKPISPVGSSGAQEGDVYDPDLELGTYGSKMPGHQVTSTVSACGTMKPAVSESQLLSIHGESHQKGKGQTQVDSSKDSDVTDAELVMLSQESGPFTPQFEDISDDEDEQKNEVTGILASKSSSSLLSRHQFNIPSISSTTTVASKHSRGDVSSSSDVGHDLGIGSAQISHITSASGHEHLCLAVTTQSDFSQRPTSNPSVSSKLDVRQDSPSSSTNVSNQVQTSWPKYVHEDKPNVCSQIGKTASSHGLIKSSSSSLCKNSSSSQPTKSSASPQMPSTLVHFKHDTKHSPTSTESIRLEHLGKEDQDSSLVKSESEIAHSPKTENVENRCKDTGKSNSKSETSHISPRLDRDSRDSRDSCDSRDSRESPKSDREGKHTGSPKVPPLKIIMPPKTTAQEKIPQCHQKAVSSRSGLPYVLNPTQEGEQTSTSTVTQSTASLDPTTTASEQHMTMSTLSEELASQCKELHEDNLTTGASVTSTVDTGIRRGRHRSTDKNRASGDKDSSDKDSHDGSHGKDGEGSRDSDISEDKESSHDSGSDKKDVHVEKRITRSAFRCQQQKEKEQHSGSGKSEFVARLLFLG